MCKNVTMLFFGLFNDKRKKWQEDQLPPKLKVTNVLKFKCDCSIPQIQLHTSLYVLTENTVLYFTRLVLLI